MIRFPLFQDYAESRFQGYYRQKESLMSLWCLHWDGLDTNWHTVIVLFGFCDNLAMTCNRPDLVMKYVKGLDKVVFFSRSVDTFLISPQSMCCRYSLEAPHWGAQYLFIWRNKENVYFGYALSWKNCVIIMMDCDIGLEKKFFLTKKWGYFSYFSMETYVLDTH